MVSVSLHEREGRILEGEDVEVLAGIESRQALLAGDGVTVEIEHSQRGKGGPEVVGREMGDLVHWYVR